MRRRSLLTMSCAVVVGSAVAACSSKGGSDNVDGSSPSGEESNASSSPTVSATVPTPEGWQSLQATIQGHSVTIEVAPLVTLNASSTLLPVRVRRAANDPVTKEFGLYGPWGGFGNKPAPTGVRLVDGARGVVWTTTAGSALAWFLDPGENELEGVPFGAVDAEKVTVMLPFAGFVDVDVISYEEGKKLLEQPVFDALIKKVNPDPNKGERVELEKHSAALDHSILTRHTDKSLTVDASGDVLFATDTAELSDRAGTVLGQLAQDIAAYPQGGSLTITGHTDDVADDAYNQTLSERRAKAVADKLGTLTDLSAWQVSTSGMGETEPRVADTTDEARAANRRVEVVVTPTGGTASSKTSTPTGTLPAAEGPVAKGAEGVTVKWPGVSDGELVISLPQVKRRGGFLFGEVEVKGGAGGSDVNLGSWFDFPDHKLGNPRKEEDSDHLFLRSMDGLTLAADGQRWYTADYMSAEHKIHINMTEKFTIHVLAEGEKATLCAIWPDIGQNSVTLDFAPGDPVGRNGHPWRLTDIPVVDA